MKRKFTFLLMALLALAGLKGWGQETKTLPVYPDGTDVHEQVPVITGWFDEIGTMTQFIIPSSDLAAITGGSISQLQFDISDEGTYSSIQNVQIKCCLKEVGNEVFSTPITSGLTEVFEGILSFTSTKMTVPFSSSFDYSGGNLLVSFEVTYSQNNWYTGYKFYGKNTDYPSAYSNKYEPHTNNFLPRTTITYTGGSSCIAPTGLAASNITAEGATISWNNNGAESYNLDVNGTVYENVTNPYILDVELSTTYTVKVQAVCDEDETSAWSSGINFTTPDCWDGHTINYTLNDSYCDGWNGAYLTIVDSDDNTIETLNFNSGCTISGSLTLCSGTYDFVWHKGPYDSECSFSISENEETLFTCNNASYYTDGQVVYTLDLLEKFSITLTQPESAAVGTISADYEQAAAGTTVTLSATPAFGYEFGAWVEDYEDVTIEDNQFTMPEHDVTISATFNELTQYDINCAELTEGTIYAEHDGVIITEAPAGTEVTLVAEPNAGYTLDHFTVDGEPIVGNTFTMPENDVTVSATFRRVYTLTVNDGTDVYSRAPFYGGGAYSYYTKSQFVIPASYMEDMQGGKISQLKFYLNVSSYYYSEYSNDTWDVYVKELDDPSGDWWDFYDFGTMTKVYSGSISIVNNELTITFNEPFQYNDKSLMIGFNQTQTGFNGMTYWLGSNNTTGSAGPNRCRAGWQSGSQYETKPFLPKTTFTYIPGETYTVTVIQPATGGSIDAYPKTDVTSGTTVELTATPETGYDLSEWIVTNVTTSQPITVTNNQFTMPDSDVTVSATFAQLTQHNVNISQSIENGTVTASPSACYKGETVTLTFEPASGYANPNYNDIIVTDASSGSVDVQYDSGNYYFIMPNSDVTVFATFNRLYNISLGSYEHGEVLTYPADNAVYEASVNISVKPYAGYQISSITVDYEGGQITPDYWGLYGEYHTYNFTMPAYDVTVSATFALEPQDLTVNNGTVTNYNVLFNSYSTDNLTKSQFIIPASDLANMYDGTITNLTFYHDKSNSFDFTGTWNVYVKEVDYTEIQNNDYFPTSADDLVYTGSLSFYNSMLTIALSESYQYNDGNLMICFEQTNQGNYLANTQWYGVSTQGNTSRGGYDYNDGGGWHGNNSFLPKTTFRYMPSANPQTRYAITVNQPEVGGTISASKELAVEGATISLTATPAEGYILNQWIVTDGDGTIAVTNNQFTVRTSNVAVTAVFETLPRYEITITPNEHGTVSVNPQQDDYLEGTQIYINANGNTGWTLADNGLAITPSVEIHEQWGSYYFEMPASNVTISAEFRELEQYTVTYHINGVESQETVYEEESFYPSQPTLPAGTEWYGWVTADLENSYSTIQPENRFYGGEISEDMDLYAVFKFTEIIPLGGESSWSQIYNESELEDGDRFILASSIYSYEDYKTHYYMMSQRNEEFGNHFTSTEGYPTYSSTSYRYEFTNLPSNVTILTAEKLEGNNWKFHFVDAYKGENTLANVYGSNLVPYDLWSGVDACETWNVEWGLLKSTLDDYQYVCLTNDLIFNIDNYNQAYIYREVKPTQTNYYYMTEVLGFGGADEHITANTSATNVVIAKNAKLTINNGATLNVEGICLSASHDAAQLVIADGGQLITDNAGVLATMKKNINGTDWYTISSPLAASVNVTDVTNLIPGNNIAAKTYDLYRLNEAEGIWENARPETDQEPAFTTIDKGCGYIYANNAGADHIAFAGEINVADVECNLTNGAAHGFNLIGNPFSQNITLANVTGTAELADGFYVLNNDETWGTKLTENDIKPLQGFLVQATEEGGTARISKNASVRGERSKEQSTNIEMIVSNSIYRDNAFAMFGEGTGLNKVSHRNAQAPMLYIPQDGEDFAIAFMDENTTVFPVSFKAMTTGSYSISLKATDDVSTLVLVDNMTGVETNMLLEDSYTFIGSPADNENRFTVKLTISHNDGQSDSEHFAYQNGSELIINGEGTLQIFDILGRVVISEEVYGQTVNVSGLNTGAYIVRLTGESVKTQKIVVR